MGWTAPSPGGRGWREAPGEGAEKHRRARVNCGPLICAELRTIRIQNMDLVEVAHLLIVSTRHHAHSIDRASRWGGQRPLPAGKGGAKRRVRGPDPARDSIRKTLPSVPAVRKIHEARFYGTKPNGDPPTRSSAALASFNCSAKAALWRAPTSASSRSCEAAPSRVVRVAVRSWTMASE